LDKENVMEMTRRQFSLSSLGMFLLAAASSAWTFGCNTLDNIVKWLGVGTQALNSVVGLLTGAGIINTVEGAAISLVLKLIKAGFADVQAAVDEYDRADPASKLTLKGKISTALQALTDQIQKFWNDLSIPNSQLAGLIQGILGVILTAIAGFMTQLPTPVTPSTSMQLSRRISVTPRKMNAQQFVSEINTLLNQAGQSQFSIR
jgi:hypothetical protein